MTKELITKDENYAYANPQQFEGAQRIAKSLSASTMIPKEYQGNVANCLIALEIAQRTKSSPFMVMQNIDIIHGRPSWRSTYIIAAVNACGRFEPLRFEMFGEGETRACVAWTVAKGFELPKGVGGLADAKEQKLPIIEGPEVSMAMAKAEGWSTKKGSKWITMPELMLRYRSAAFFGRLYAPEILMGMQTDSEIYDVSPVEYKEASPSIVDTINEDLAEPIIDVEEVEEVEVETETEETAEGNEEPEKEYKPFPGDAPAGENGDLLEQE